jgi:hypothetical protein
MPYAVRGGAPVLAVRATESRRRPHYCIVRLAAACAMLTLVGVPARAASHASPENIAACKALSDHAADLIRAGQTVMTTRAQLRRCVRIQRAERRRAGQPAETGGRAP